MPKTVSFEEMGDIEESVAKEQVDVKIPSLPSSHSFELTSVLAYLDEYDALINDKNNTTVNWLVSFFANHQKDGAALLENFMNTATRQQQEDFIALLYEKNEVLLRMVSALLVGGAEDVDNPRARLFKTFIENAANYPIILEKKLSAEIDLLAMKAAEQLDGSDKNADAKIAMVDIDGCLVIEKDGGKILNPALIDRLQQGAYSQIILFTQRSKFMRYEDCFKHDPFVMVDDRLNSTPDIMAALKKALGSPLADTVAVSTSVDSAFGQALAYYPGELADFERDYQALRVAYVRGEIDQVAYQEQEKIFKIDILQELQAIAKKLTLSDIEQMATATANNAGRSISIEVKAQIALSETQRLSALLAAINTEALTTLQVKSSSELSGLISQWKTFHPTQKIQQNYYLDQFLLATAQHVSKDYYDDSYANISEIIASQPVIPIQSLVVKEEFLIPLTVYQENNLSLTTEASRVFTGIPLAAKSLMKCCDSDDLATQAFAVQCLTTLEANRRKITDKIIDLFSVVPADFTLVRSSISLGQLFRSTEQNNAYYQEKLHTAVVFLVDSGNFLMQKKLIGEAQLVLKAEVSTYLANTLSAAELGDSSRTIKLTQFVCYQMNMQLLHAFQQSLLDAYKKGPPTIIDMEKLTTDFNRKYSELLRPTSIESTVVKAQESMAFNTARIPPDHALLDELCHYLTILKNPPVLKFIAPKIDSVMPGYSVDLAAINLLKDHLLNLRAEAWGQEDAAIAARFKQFEALTQRDAADRNDELDSTACEVNVSPDRPLTDHDVLKDLLASHFDQAKLAAVTELKLPAKIRVTDLSPCYLEHIEHLFHASRAIVDALDVHEQQQLHNLLPPVESTHSALSSVGDENLLHEHLDHKDCPHASLAAAITLFMISDKA